MCPSPHSWFRPPTGPEANQNLVPSSREGQCDWGSQGQGRPWCSQRVRAGLGSTRGVHSPGREARMSLGQGRRTCAVAPETQELAPARLGGAGLLQVGERWLSEPRLRPELRARAGHAKAFASHAGGSEEPRETPERGSKGKAPQGWLTLEGPQEPPRVTRHPLHTPRTPSASTCLSSSSLPSAWPAWCSLAAGCLRPRAGRWSRLSPSSAPGGGPSCTR